MKNLLKEFKEFALRGNVMELAVAVIMGAAFQGINRGYYFTGSRPFWWC